MVYTTTQAAQDCSDMTGNDVEAVEHVFVEEGSVEQCVLLPAEGKDALASEWITAEEGSFVSLDDVR